MKYLITLLTVILFTGCIANSNPHQIYINVKNHNIGLKWNPQPSRLNPADKGKVHGTRKIGDGLTHITKGKDGNNIYHIFDYECLKNGSLLGWEPIEEKGKCLIYYRVDSKSNIILDWGFDKGSNPKCCAITG